MEGRAEEPLPRAGTQSGLALKTLLLTYSGSPPGAGGAICWLPGSQGPALRVQDSLRARCSLERCHPHAWSRVAPWRAGGRGLLSACLPPAFSD